MSCIKIGEDPTNLEEGFPDAQLFAVHIAHAHLEDIIHFLMTTTALEGYSIEEKRELMAPTVEFFVTDGHLYGMGCDEVL